MPASDGHESICRFEFDQFMPLAVGGIDQPGGRLVTTSHRNDTTQFPTAQL
jgi:hypothetical protein